MRTHSSLLNSMFRKFVWSIANICRKKYSSATGHKIFDSEYAEKLFYIELSWKFLKDADNDNDDRIRGTNKCWVTMDPPTI